MSPDFLVTFVQSATDAARAVTGNLPFGIGTSSSSFLDGFACGYEYGYDYGQENPGDLNGAMEGAINHCTAE